jgi:hypothetical protein
MDYTDVVGTWKAKMDKLSHELIMEKTAQESNISTRRKPNSCAKQ